MALLGDERRELELRTVTLDAAFVMKAALVASGLRTRVDRRITDTVDAVMLAAACVDHDSAIQSLAEYSKHSEVRTACRWIAEEFPSPRAAMPQRVASHFGTDDAPTWAVDVARAFVASLKAARQ